jgi:hypothetical protein
MNAYSTTLAVLTGVRDEHSIIIPHSDADTTSRIGDDALRIILKGSTSQYT